MRLVVLASLLFGGDPFCCPEPLGLLPTAIPDILRINPSQQPTSGIYLADEGLSRQRMRCHHSDIFFHVHRIRVLSAYINES
ncbi:hypothetical protein V8C26DRAFT_404449 [Trichoderma gracile]